VPYTAGGGYDVNARLLQPFYEKALGASIVIENRAGADGRIGARVLHDAEPDGRTLGILNGTSLLVQGLVEGLTGLHPVNDFTVLGGVAVTDPVWVTTPGSGITSIEDILARRGEAPILFGANGVGSTGFVAVSAAADLLGVDVAYVMGYPGTREASLGLMRGEFDVAAINFESIRDRVEAGNLIPLLRISSAGFDAYPYLSSVPVLAGPDGLAARVARERGEDPEQSVALSAALAGIFEVGRFVAGPPGLDPHLAACLSGRLAQIVRDPEFRALAERAQRAVDFAEPAALAAELEAAEQEQLTLVDAFRRHAALARGEESVR
jgi:tripartite-type tricarboxylate transporter receptor subunit TctC